MCIRDRVELDVVADDDVVGQLRLQPGAQAIEAGRVGHHLALIPI